MSDEHYVVLGLAQVRAGWFGDVSRWATTAALPVDFLKCISAEELRARLASGRPCSAVLVDGALGALDRDLVDLARSHGAPVMAIDAGHVRRDWVALGIVAVLVEPLERDALATALRQHGRPLRRADAPLFASATGAEEPAPRPPGRLVAVCGAGGCGTSTIAVAVAQAAAGRATEGSVLLADLARQADQAMLHDVGDVIPGIQELTDAHRGAVPTPETMRGLTFRDDARGYHVLLGLRQPRDWTTLRPRAFEAALETTLRAFSLTVADTDIDLEGEDDCGSIDVEERNVMSRSAVARADVVVVTGNATLVGLHRMARGVAEVLRFGVEPRRVLPLVNRASRSPARRAEIARALAELTAVEDRAVPLASALFVPERRRLDEYHRDGAPLPGSFVMPIGDAVRAVLQRSGTPPPEREPVPIAPGTLGSWRDDPQP
jgi:hypothetical protein